jgi:hypothetical protein
MEDPIHWTDIVNMEDPIHWTDIVNIWKTQFTIYVYIYRRLNSLNWNSNIYTV